MMPESQSGDDVGLLQSAPHSVALWGLLVPLKSHATVSPTLIVVSQTPPENDELQNQLSPTAMLAVSCALAGPDESPRTDATASRSPAIRTATIIGCPPSTWGA